jgi:hypothetical protein
MAGAVTLNIRIPQDLLDRYSGELLEKEREETGIRSLTRNELIVKAMEYYLRSKG